MPINFFDIVMYNKIDIVFFSVVLFFLNLLGLVLGGIYQKNPYAGTISFCFFIVGFCFFGLLYAWSLSLSKRKKEGKRTVLCHNDRRRSQ